MSDETIFVPKGYGFARIGSVMNYMTREFQPRLHAFEMSQLDAIGRINRNQATLHQTIQANAYSTKTQNSWSIGTSTKLSAKFPLASTSMEFHTSNASSKLNTSSGLELTVAMSFRNYEMVLNQDVTEDELYSCATPKFKKALDDIAAATTIIEWEVAYLKFHSQFGNGFVSSLKLISCAAGKLESSYTSTASKQAQKYGGSVAAGGISGGVSIASEWSAEQLNNSSEGTLNASVVALPAESPCATWASGYISNYSGQALSVISEKPPGVDPFTPVEAKAPDIPVVEKPKEKSLPDVKLKSTDEMIKFMRIQQMKNDGVDVLNITPDNFDKTWGDYQADIKVKAAALDKDKIAKDKKENPDPKKNSNRSSSNMRKRVSAEIQAFDLQTQENKMATGSGGDFDFGNYAICGFDFTSYNEVFPSLKLAYSPTLSGFYLAKINMFILTRQMIGSYLAYLSELPSKITGGYVRNHEVLVYESVLLEFMAYVVDYITENIVKNPIVDENHYLDVISKFDELLGGNKEFKLGLSIYQCYVENYEYLSNAPYGFLLKAHYLDNTYYPEWNSWTKLSDYFPQAPNLTKLNGQDSVAHIAPKSYRFIPVISGGETPSIGFACYVPWLKNVTDENDQDSWASLGVSGTLSVGNRPGDYKFFIDKNGDVKIKSVSEYDKYNDIDLSFGVYSDQLYFVSENIGYVDPMTSEQKKAYPADQIIGGGGISDRAPVILEAINYQNTLGTIVHGIPMWFESDFDLMKDSVLRGFSDED